MSECVWEEDKKFNLLCELWGQEFSDFETNHLATVV